MVMGDFEGKIKQHKKILFSKNRNIEFHGPNMCYNERKLRFE